MTKHHLPIAFALVGIFVYTNVSLAQMSSSSYLIRWDSVNTGGSDTGSSSSYQLRDSVEALGDGRTSSASYNLDQGYRGGIFDPLISFDLRTQDLSTGRVATALSSLTVTVSSVSGISVGDYIVLLQNQGLNQVSAFGKVTAVGSSTLTVDSWTNAGTTPVIDGTNDYVYVLSGSTISFGTLSSSSVSTAIVSFEVSADSASGYVVQVNDDGNFRSGSNDIDDVTDGTVSDGSEEFGARSSDTTLASSTFDTDDSAITTTRQDVVTKSSVSMADRNFVTLKISISTSTAAGSYANVISFIASGNF
ncbi:hypothetical protein HZA87_03625 [Candidatus Uhrbacteria bacterium]|nr:hypothetical protein [Candidatus Uhrbacteria bacterium]